jgi:hypothetical protein
MCAAVIAVDFRSVALKGEFLEPYRDPYVRRPTFNTTNLITPDDPRTARGPDLHRIFGFFRDEPRDEGAPQGVSKMSTADQLSVTDLRSAAR